MRQIDPQGIVTALPDLSTVEAVARGGRFAGCSFCISWSERWKTKLGEGWFHLNAATRDDIVLDSMVGEITLRRSMVTHSDSDGRVEGIANAVELNVVPAEPETQLVYRTFIKTTEDLLTSLYFPRWFCDVQRDRHHRAQALLPLDTGDAKLDIYFIKEGPYIVVDTPLEADDGDNRDRAQKIVGAACLLLTYLTGVPFDADGCHVVVAGSTNRLLSARWYRGRRDRHSYRPIPCSWLDWASAQRVLGLPLEGGAEGALRPDVVSACLAQFIKQPELVTPVEYLIRFPGAPGEMRGAFLSVALESLTAHLQKTGLLDSVTLLPEEAWGALKTQLLEAVEAVSGELSEGQRRAIRNRIDGLNRATNSQKLKLPFESLGVNIDGDEKRAIDRRNKLLHQGRLLDPKTVADKWRDAYKVEMHMYTAINKLLLKYLGYEGPVIDWGRTSMESGEQSYLLM